MGKTGAKKTETGNIDLFGNAIERDAILRDYFLEPPFSVLDTRSGLWQNRKRLWISRGLKSEIGRGNEFTKTTEDKKNLAVCMPNSLGSSYGRKNDSGISVFDPVLCELMYRWFAPVGGTVLDVFAGGSVRGIVANYLGYKYTGIDLRAEQVRENIAQAIEILENKNKPVWLAGDSDIILDSVTDTCDFLFTCPPYMDLEVYSDMEADLSNMRDADFILKYESIIKKSIDKLKQDSFACIVVGEVRDKKTGVYKNFNDITKRAFLKCGLHFYNDIVLINAIGTASIRASGQMKNRKVVKTHQNVFVFYKGNPGKIQERFPPLMF